MALLISPLEINASISGVLGEDLRPDSRDSRVTMTPRALSMKVGAILLKLMDAVRGCWRISEESKRCAVNAPGPVTVALSDIMSTSGGSGGEERDGLGIARNDLMVCRKEARGTWEDVNRALGKSSIKIIFLLTPVSEAGGFFMEFCAVEDSEVGAMSKLPNLPALPTNSSKIPASPGLKAPSSPYVPVVVALGFFHSCISNPNSRDRTLIVAVFPAPAEPFRISRRCLENPSRTCSSQDRTSDTFFG